jgi:hypothetical protein
MPLFTIPHLRLLFVSIACTNSIAGAPIEVHQRLLENLQYEWFWFGRTPVGGEYRPGRNVSVLFFQPKRPDSQSWGICAPALRRCFTYGERVGPAVNSVEVSPNQSPTSAFEAYLKTRMQPLDQIVPMQTVDDFELSSMSIRLPKLHRPAGITGTQPAENRTEAKKMVETLLAPSLSCTSAPLDDVKTLSAKREFWVGRRGPVDQYWFVLRRCSYPTGRIREDVYGLQYDNDFAYWALRSSGYIGQAGANTLARHIAAVLRRELLVSVVANE